MNFGQLLKKARKSKRATLREVADAGGISIGYVSDIEHGRRRAPGMDVVRRIERYLTVQDSSLTKAAKATSDLPQEAKRIIGERPAVMALLRASAELSDEEIDKLIRQIRGMKEE
jgi:transcriptional regulator with XRE-family HTH domain